MQNFSDTQRTRLLRGTAIAAIALTVSLPAYAQVTIDDARTTAVNTSTAGDGGVADDVTIGTDGSVTLTDDVGPAVVLDSDNDLTNNGAISIADVDNAVGVSLEGGADRSFTNNGSITLVEDYTPTDTDDDPFVDGPVAIGTGRTGILISGASPFQGNVDLAAGSFVSIEGNDSYGINLTNTPMMTDGLTGNLTTAGTINITGDNSYGVNVAGNVTGDLENRGVINVSGEGSTAYGISGDIQGGFVNSGSLLSNGYRFNSRVPLNAGSVGRNDLTEEDLLQAGSAIQINGNISGGIHLEQRRETDVDENGDPILDEDGNETTSLVASSSLSQFGSAPAVLIDGEGSILSIGVVAPITNPSDPDFDETLQYAFINEGIVGAQGVYDDFDATTLSVTDATLDGGISNTGTMTAVTFRSPTELDVARGTGMARVIVLGDQAIADSINNEGVIFASSSEAVDEVYLDASNPLAPMDVTAIAIDIGANASSSTITNTGGITASIVARNGRAVAIQDASGTLTAIDNTGAIAALGNNSDASGLQETDFTLIAIDVSANTTGFTYTQSLAVDEDPDDDISPTAPRLVGSVLMGSGDDSIIATAGTITGDNIDFGGGVDTLSLSGGSSLTADVTNSGSLAISVTDGSALALTGPSTISVSDATFDGTSTFSPILNGASGMASTLDATGDITFEAGASITPLLNDILGSANQTFTIAQAGNLTVDDLAGLSSGSSPFLYDTSFALSDPNTLVITLDLRDPSASLAEGGLGLDQVQQGAFGAAFEAMANTTGLGNAIANITNSADFYNAYNQLLPEFAAAPMQFVVSNVDGATGAVANHLTSARRSPEKPGGAWLQQFAYFADRDKAGLSEQYRGSGFGLTGGLDTALGPFHSVGVNFGFASTEIEDVIGSDQPLDVFTLQGGAYAGYTSGKLGVDFYAGGGYNSFEQERRVVIGDFFGDSKGDWNGYHINGSVRAGYDVELNEKFWLRPSLSVDYLRLTENAYTEEGDAGIAVAVNKRTSDRGAATAMIDLGARFQGKRTWIRPSIRAGYRYEFLNDPIQTSFRYAGLENDTGIFDGQIAELQSIAFPDQGILLGFSLAAGSAYSSIGFDFDSDIRDGFIRHTGRIVVRLLF